MKYSRRSYLGGIDDALGEFRHRLRSEISICFLPLAALDPWKHYGSKRARVAARPAKTTVVAVPPEVN